jgi:hypothetical protein
LPTLSDEVEVVALPPTRVRTVAGALSIMKETVPVGVPLPGALAATVTVIVTVWPNVDGFCNDMIIVAVPS